MSCDIVERTIQGSPYKNTPSTRGTQSIMEEPGRAGGQANDDDILEGDDDMLGFDDSDDEDNEYEDEDNSDDEDDEFRSYIDAYPQSKDVPLDLINPSLDLVAKVTALRHIRCL